MYFSEPQLPTSNYGLGHFHGLGEDCGTACLAMRSMQRSADSICRLAGTFSLPCIKAKARVAAARARMLFAGCDCSEAVPPRVASPNSVSGFGQFPSPSDVTPSGPRRPIPYREAQEAFDRKLMADMARDCANVEVLQTLDRVGRTPAERVAWLERKISSMPRILEGHRLRRELFARRRAGRLNKVQLNAALMGLHHAFPEIREFPLAEGYAAGTVAQEVAKARCELSRARWELRVFEQTGRVPGRLSR